MRRDESRNAIPIDKVSVTWSLECVLMELQVLSMLPHSTVLALRIHGGAVAASVTFTKKSRNEAFWEFCAALERRSVPSSSFASVIATRHFPLATDTAIFDS